MVGTRAIVITGCSSGIGYCVAHQLRQRGYRVFATARRESDVQRLRKEGLESLLLDLADSQSIFQATGEILAATDGNVYALFNNGAYGQPGAVEDVSRAALREQFETNLFGAHELTNLLLPTMRRNRQGRIIQNSSILGLIALSYRGAYNASKFALEGLSDTLRLELRGSGVYVSLIEPGPIVSRFRANAYQAFQRHIDVEASVHRETYRSMTKRFTALGPVAPFTLPAEAVLKRVIHALESRRPKARYYVTFPTYLFAGLRRLLPHALLDEILFRTSVSERK